MLRTPALGSLVLATCALSPACASLSSFKEAHAIDPGTVRFDVAGAGLGATPKSGATAFLNGARPLPYDTTEQARTFPAIELQLRLGLLRGFDLGLKTSLSSIEVNGTVELARGDRLELALAPAFQGAIGSNGDDEGWSIRLLKLPLLTGIRFGEGGQHELVLGPALAKSWGSGTSKNSGYTIDALFAGGTLGVSLDAGPIGRVIPEIALYTTLSGNGVALPGYVVRVSPDVGRGSPVLFEAGIAFSFGGRSSGRSVSW